MLLLGLGWTASSCEGLNKPDPDPRRQAYSQVGYKLPQSLKARPVGSQKRLRIHQTKTPTTQTQSWREALNLEPHGPQLRRQAATAAQRPQSLQPCSSYPSRWHLCLLIPCCWPVGPASAPPRTSPKGMDTSGVDPLRFLANMWGCCPQGMEGAFSAGLHFQTMKPLPSRGQACEGP